MKYPKEYLDEIKTRLKVSTVVSKSVSLKKRGKEFVGLSPFKTEKTPSFTVNDEKEFDLLSSFLPQQLNEEDTKKICIDTISKLGAESIKDMGKVMGELKKQYPDNLDFAKAGPLLKELLNKQ